jgi:hypothetical protein
MRKLVFFYMRLMIILLLSYLDPNPYLNFNTHYRVVTEVDQEKGRCTDRFWTNLKEAKGPEWDESGIQNDFIDWSPSKKDALRSIEYRIDRGSLQPLPACQARFHPLTAYIQNSFTLTHWDLSSLRKDLTRLPIVFSRESLTALLSARLHFRKTVDTETSWVEGDGP